MSFQKKQRSVATDGRPQSSKLAQREQKVSALKVANNPDARKLLKRMNDVVYRGSRTNLNEWFKPKGHGISAKA